MKIKKDKCIFCGENDKRIIKVNVFKGDHVYACENCINYYGGLKDFREAYELCNVAFNMF